MKFGITLFYRLELDEYDPSVAHEPSLPVEFGARVTKAVLAGAELAEILGSFGDNVIIELEDDTTRVLAADLDVELKHLWETSKP
jgi:hypothetical protein